MNVYFGVAELLPHLMSVQYVVCLISQELGLVITGTLPVFNKTNTGSKVQHDTSHLFYTHSYFKSYLFYSMHAYSWIVP